MQSRGARPSAPKEGTNVAVWRGRAADALFLAQRLAEGEVQELGHQVEEHVFLHHRDLPKREAMLRNSLCRA